MARFRSDPPRARSKTRALLTLFLPVLVGLILPCAASAAGKGMIWGPTDMPNGESAFPLYRDLGVRIFQIQLAWDRVASVRPADSRDPRDPAYNWPKAIDKAVAEGGRYGIRVAIQVRGTPRWANGGFPNSLAPTSSASYAHFLTAASRRYPTVHRWMIWGEPNRAANFQPLPRNRRVGPRRYARLLDAAYGALKRRNRRNLVIGGMTFSFGEVLPYDFLKWMRLPSGRPPRLDYYGHNPYTRRFPRLRRRLGHRGFRGARDFGDLRRFAREIHRTYGQAYRRFRRHGPRLWLSEFSVSSDRPNRAFDFSVSRRGQAQWLSAAYRIAGRERSVAALGWFNLLDEPTTVAGGLTTGLMTFDGKRKPAYFSYRKANRRPPLQLRLSFRRGRTAGGRGCARSRVRARVDGPDRVRVRRVRFSAAGRSRLDRRAPFTAIVHRPHRGRSHRHRVRAQARMNDGRLVRLATGFRACARRR